MKKGQYVDKNVLSFFICMPLCMLCLVSVIFVCGVSLFSRMHHSK